MGKGWRILFLVCLLGAYFSWRDRSIQHPPGILAPHEPLQQAVDAPSAGFEKNGYLIKPLYYFEAEARVLAKKDYRFDRGAAISPVDLALGWGRMSDSAVLAKLEISQGGRFFTWRSRELPIPLRDIVSHSANMHMIPATPGIEKRLKAIRQGHIVKFSGYLAEVSADDGWRWRSSTVRTDTGSGACELVWTELLTVH